MRRASSRVSGSISYLAAEGASIKAATLRVIRPRRTAIRKARDSIRWTFKTVLGERPRRSMVSVGGVQVLGSEPVQTMLAE